MIYVILAPEVDRVKIGRSINIESRLKGLQTGHSQELCLVMTIDKPDEYESELHQRFKAHNVRGEWFQMCPDIARFILFNCGWNYGPTPRPAIASAFACLERHCPEECQRIIDAYFQVTGTR